MGGNVNSSETEGAELAWLGDDFTGAAAVMEVLSFAGLPSILFLDVPTRQELAACKGYFGFGIATMARAQTPGWMAEHLPQLFTVLNQTGASLIHYKICSTLDSSPQTGSIGKAVELACHEFGDAAVPVVVAAPKMQRYQIFGNLFCAFDGEIFRLDRHPVMARHPVTPMQEADVARHLMEQTDLPVGCLNLADLRDPPKAMALLDATKVPHIWTLDMHDAEDECIVGKMLWERRGRSRFVVGSQGIEYALVSHFRQSGRLREGATLSGIGRADRMVAVSGSVSEVTAAQIDWARRNGFATIRLDVARLVSGEAGRIEAEQEAIDASKKAMAEGQCPLVCSAEGPDDPAVTALQASSLDLDAANRAIGQTLGRVLKRLVDETGVRRAVVSGGDTSGLVCRELGIYALEALAPTIPGASICRAKSRSTMDGFEIALKGGQMGSRDYFGWVRDGGGERHD